jgi:hypothetical protein
VRGGRVPGMADTADQLDEYLVQRAVECLLDDLDDDDAFQRLTPEERAAAWRGSWRAWSVTAGLRRGWSHWANGPQML